MTQNSVEYEIRDISDIELIRPLWNQLNEHHHANARAFRHLYAHGTFDDRKAYFHAVSEAGLFRLDLARDPVSGKYAGYCISSLSQDKNGEIESLFVDKIFRSRGIGTELLTRALAWLDANGSVRNRVPVADGNEEVFPFYRKFGFHPRMTVLEQTRD